jgi:hypothetical protein
MWTAEGEEKAGSGAVVVGLKNAALTCGFARRPAIF